MTKELSKEIMKRSKFENLYFSWPSRENLLAYKYEKKKQFQNNNQICEKVAKKVNQFGMQSNPFSVIYN